MLKLGSKDWLMWYAALTHWRVRNGLILQQNPGVSMAPKASRKIPLPVLRIYHTDVCELRREEFSEIASPSMHFHIPERLSEKKVEESGIPRDKMYHLTFHPKMTMTCGRTARFSKEFEPQGLLHESISAVERIALPLEDALREYFRAFPHRKTGSLSSELVKRCAAYEASQGSPSKSARHAEPAIQWMAHVGEPASSSFAQFRATSFPDGGSGAAASGTFSDFGYSSSEEVGTGGILLALSLSMNPLRLWTQ
jgi:hypothetical protein